jgi:hypothetical protein
VSFYALPAEAATGGRRFAWISIWQCKADPSMRFEGFSTRQSTPTSKMPVRKRSRRGLGFWHGASRSTFVSPGLDASSRLRCTVDLRVEIPQPGCPSFAASEVLFPRSRRVVMKQINLAEAKTQLLRLVEQAARGKGVIIAKSGIPMAKLVSLER